MFDERAITLLRETKEKTDAKKLAWQETAEAGNFIVAIEGKYTLRLFPYTRIGPRGNQEGGPSVSLFEGEDLVLDVSNEVAGVLSAEMDDLYETVRRQVYKVDEKVDDAISFLKNL